MVLEIERRVKADLRQTGDFAPIHPMPPSGHDVADDLDVRLVVLGTDHPHGREAENPAVIAAQAILELRGTAPRLHRNTLVFLAADKGRLHELDEAVRRYLAWESILAERNELNLNPQQVKQAETQKTTADGTATARIPETYPWLLVPTQATPSEKVQWEAHRLAEPEPLAIRASKKLHKAELLVTTYAATWLRRDLDRIPLWRGDHVSVRQLADDYADNLYLTRLRAPSVLHGAIREGVALLSWEQDGFAYADSYDEAAARYRGLRAAKTLPEGELTGLLVKPEIARRQMEAEDVAPTLPSPSPGPSTTEPGPSPVTPGGEPATPPPPTPPKRFHGTVPLDATRVGRDASRIADEVITHLSGLVGATVKVTLEIEAEIPDGAPDHVVRTVTENSRTLRFSSQGFEEE